MDTMLKERVYRDVMDKSDWGPGPWQDEPDKVQWTDPATGLPCLAVRNQFGSWCGYVGVSEGHPAFGQGYDAVDAGVHGGLTFADHCQQGPEDRAVCHVPEPGQSDHIWWLGFDCAHAGDAAPAMNAHMRMSSVEPIRGDVYRTLEYVRGEVTNLARQLRAGG